MHQYGQPGHDPVRVEHQRLRRQPAQQRGRCSPVIDAVRNTNQRVDVCQPACSIAAVTRSQAPDAVTDLELRHLRPDHLDRTDRLEPGDPRQRQGLVETGPHIDVVKVHAHRGLAQPHLARAGITDLDLFHLQHLGTAGDPHHDRFWHAPLLLIEGWDFPMRKRSVLSGERGNNARL